MKLLLSGNISIYSAKISLFEGGEYCYECDNIRPLSDLRADYLFGSSLTWYLDLYSYIY